MIQLSIELRAKLSEAGFSGIERALRWAAVEAEAVIGSGSLDLFFGSDDESRHLGSFLAWAETVFVGVSKAIRAIGDQSLFHEWEQVRNQPLRQLMNCLRNEALKGRKLVASLRPIGDSDDVVALRFIGPCSKDWEDRPVIGTLYDFLNLILESAIPILLKVIEQGGRGDDATSRDDLPHAERATWTPFVDPEFRMKLAASEHGIPLTEQELSMVDANEQWEES